MEESKFISAKTDIMKLLKENFGLLPFWKTNEVEIALICAELTEPITKERKIRLIEQLKSLKQYFYKQGILMRDLAFIDKEIHLYENTKMVSLYMEEDEEMDPKTIFSYAKMYRDSQGIISIEDDFNYAQLRKLTNGIFKETSLVKFFISREKTIYGKIVAEINEQALEISLARIVESRRIDKETGEPKFKGVKLFGEPCNKSEFNIIREIGFPFYIYRFISEENREFMLVTLKQCEIGDYMVSGVQTKCDDYRLITDSVRLPTKLPYFFVHSMKSRIIRFANHDQFKSRLDYLKINKNTLFDFPFCVTNKSGTWRLLQPTWYKWLIWAWLTHESKGAFNNYPMHLFIIGEKNSGKSLLLNILHSKSKEARNIFSGSSSTLKSLVPSFKYSPARIGYLAESNRFAFCDEFLRCLINTRSTKEGSQREESVAIMNDLLEHQKREAGSGVSRVNVNMTSRIIAMTNPIREIKNVENLINSFDESFLSRWLIYYQTKEHVDLIRSSRDSTLKRFMYKLPTDDWISILDYLHTFSAEYDKEKIEDIFQSVPQVFSENLNSHYKARHMHHLECLFDGIIKTRCFLEGDMSFKAIDEDYKILKEVWLNIIGSWLDLSLVKRIDLKERIFYLPENCQYLYWKICGEKRSLTKTEVEEIALKAMSRSEYQEAWVILVDTGIMIEFDGLARPYYFSELKDGR